MADGGDPFDQATLNEAMGSLGSYHFLGRPPVDCAGAPEEYQSICYRDATYLVWNGIGVHHRHPTLGTDYINVTELMEKVAEANPRQAS